MKATQMFSRRVETRDSDHVNEIIEKLVEGEISNRVLSSRSCNYLYKLIC